MIKSWGHDHHYEPDQLVQWWKHEFGAQIRTVIEYFIKLAQTRKLVTGCKRLKVERVFHGRYASGTIVVMQCETSGVFLYCA